jgi:hypothetical protein
MFGRWSAPALHLDKDYHLMLLLTKRRGDRLLPR